MINLHASDVTAGVPGSEPCACVVVEGGGSRLAAHQIDVWGWGEGCHMTSPPPTQQSPKPPNPLLCLQIQKCSSTYGIAPLLKRNLNIASHTAIWASLPAGGAVFGQLRHNLEEFLPLTHPKKKKRNCTGIIRKPSILVVTQLGSV